MDFDNDPFDHFDRDDSDRMEIDTDDAPDLIDAINDQLRGMR